MRCRIYRKKSVYPICKDCSSNNQKRLINSIVIINKQIRLNKFEIIIRTFKLPRVTYNFWLSLLLFMTSLLFLMLVSLLKKVELQILSALPIAIFPTVAVYFWGEIPRNNIRNGIALINIKQKNYQMMGYKKRLTALLRKNESSWSMDGRLSISFRGV